MTNRYYELYFDMDEVLVNLSKHIVEYHYNKDFNDSMKHTDNNSYWWSDCKRASKSYFEQLLLKEGVFFNAEPVESSIDILHKLHEEGFKIHIVTMPQWNSDYCIQEKIKWIQKYLPFIDINKNVCFTGNKGLLAKENRILVDDNMEHLESWANEEGVAIAFPNIGWNKDWNELRCNNFKEVYELIHKLEDEKLKEVNEEFCRIDVNKFREYFNCKLNKEGE